MKSLFLLLSIVFIVGCSYGQEKLETYLEEPEYFIKDPHFADYQQTLDELEKEYLDKKITYAEYMERRQALDEKYEKEVQERTEVIENINQP